MGKISNFTNTVGTIVNKGGSTLDQIAGFIPGAGQLIGGAGGGTLEAIGGSIKTFGKVAEGDFEGAKTEVAVTSSRVAITVAPGIEKTELLGVKIKDGAEDKIRKAMKDSGVKPSQVSDAQGDIGPAGVAGAKPVAKSDLPDH